MGGNGYNSRYIYIYKMNEVVKQEVCVCVRTKVDNSVEQECSRTAADSRLAFPALSAVCVMPVLCYPASSVCSLG